MRDRFILIKSGLYLTVLKCWDSVRSGEWAENYKILLLAGHLFGKIILI